MSRAGALESPGVAARLAALAVAALMIVACGGGGSGDGAAGGGPPDPPAPPAPDPPVPPDPQADIILTIIDPARVGRQYGDVVDIVIGIYSSEFQVDGVSAKVGNTETELTYTQEAYFNDDTDYEWAPGYVGSLDLSSYARGTQTMILTARDVTGGVRIVERTFTLNNHPVVTMSLPEDFSAVTNPVRIVASCTDDTDSCRLELHDVVGGPIRYNRDAIDVEVELWTTARNPLTPWIRGTDEFGRSDAVERSVYLVDTSVYALEAQASGIVVDVDAGRVLYHPVGSTNGPLFLMDRDTGDIEQADLPPDTAFDSARLTTTGFLLLLDDTGGAANEDRLLYEWRDGTLSLLAAGDDIETDVAGDYGVWEVDGSLVWRRFSTGDSVPVTDDGFDPAIAANGVVVFRSPTGIDWFEAGVVTPMLDHTAEAWFAQDIRTDGERVLYQRYDYPTRDGPLMLVEGDLPDDPLEIELTPAGTGLTDWAIRNGWVAYTGDVGTGQRAVWRRAPDGTVTQVSFFGDDADLVALGPDGRILMSHERSWYLSDPGDADVFPALVGPTGGDVTVTDGDFLFRFGRSVFSLTGQFAPPPDTPSAIAIYIRKPGFTDAESGDLVEVVAEIESQFQIDSIVARHETLEVPMVWSLEAYTDPYDNSPQPAWVATLDLTVVERGDQVLEVEVTDVYGGVVTQPRPFLLNNRPVLDVPEPLDQSVVSNPVRFVATCIDDTPDCEIELKHGSTYRRFRRDSIDDLINITPGSFGTASVRLHAIDAFGKNGGWTYLDLYFVDETVLAREADVPGQIVDADASRVLYRTDDADDAPLFLFDVGSGSTERIDLPADSRYDAARLTPVGLLLEVDDDAVTGGEALYEWRGDALIPLATGVVRDLDVAGDFAVWTVDNVVVRRQLSTQDDIVISGGGFAPALAANGVVVFRGGTGIDWYEGGVVTQLVNLSGAAYNADALVTDGERVAYRRHYSTNNRRSVAIIEGDLPTAPVETEVTQPASYFPDMRLANGWLAYTAPVESGQVAVWRRAPDGSIAQASFFGDDTDLDLLADDGRIVLTNDRVWYLSEPGDGPTTPLSRIDNANGQARIRDGQMVFWIGRSVFTLR